MNKQEKRVVPQVHIEELEYGEALNVYGVMEDDKVSQRDMKRQWYKLCLGFMDICGRHYGYDSHEYKAWKFSAFQAWYAVKFPQFA